MQTKKNLTVIIIAILTLSGCTKNWTEGRAGHYVGTLSCSNGQSGPGFVILTEVDNTTLRADDGMEFTMTSETAFTIESQVINGSTHSGQGRFTTANSITASYTAAQGAQSVSCQFEGTR